jgi:hypothetical protein
MLYPGIAEVLFSNCSPHFFELRPNDAAIKGIAKVVLVQPESIPSDESDIKQQALTLTQDESHCIA